MQIVVRVIDVNDNYPIASVNTLDGTSSGSGDTQTSASVPENSDVGSFVAHISVYDADTGPSGQVRACARPFPTHATRSAVSVCPLPECINQLSVSAFELLQQSPDRLASHSHPASPVSRKCRSKAHFQPETLRPHHRRAHQPSLAPRAGANYIQDGDADVSCTAWLRTTLLGVVIQEQAEDILVPPLL